MHHADRRTAGSGGRDPCRDHPRLWRKEAEAPPPGNDNGNIIDRIVMRSDLCGIADPQSRFGFIRHERHGVDAAKPGT
jgi:hypothetical protein